MKKRFIRGLKRNDYVSNICDTISDVNDSKIYSSQLMYSLDSKNENKFLSTAVKLGYHMLTRKMDNITAETMQQESTISKNS